MTRQILVPLDGSDVAEQALSCATALGRGLQAELLLLRAVSILPDAEPLLADAGLAAGSVHSRLTENAEHYLAGIAARLTAAGQPARPIVCHGPAAEAIVEYAERAGVYQIVMATHGYTGGQRWSHGSVAERVVQAARVPVLLVRERAGNGGDAKPYGCQRILALLDGSPVAEQVLLPAAEMALALGAELLLFRVAIALSDGGMMGDWYVAQPEMFTQAQEASQRYLEQVAARLRKQGVKVSTHTENGPVADTVIGYAEAQGVDLVAMTTHGHSGVGRWTLGSVADRVLRAGATPILLVRARLGREAPTRE